MGVIASVKLPLDFAKIKNTTSSFFDELEYIKHTLKDGTIDGINYITESFSSNFRVDAAIDKMLKDFEPFVYYAYENLVYGFVLDSKASEHASRMNSMKKATDNATEVVGKLELLYNRARQQAITLELTDIIGGASVINKK